MEGKGRDAWVLACLLALHSSGLLAHGAGWVQGEMGGAVSIGAYCMTIGIF